MFKVIKLVIWTYDIRRDAKVVRINKEQTGNFH